MAIAFDAGTDGGSNGGGASSLTFAHTNTGSNRLLWVGVTDSNLGVHVTGATYAGVSMTELSSSPVQIPANRYIHLYYLVNPASGANNVVISADQVQYIYGYSDSYTGVKQSGQPDATGNNTALAATTITKSITTVADNSWLMAFGRIESGTISAGTSTTSRVTGETVGGMMADRNAAITPAGSAALTFNFGLTNAAMITASFSPSVLAVNANLFFAQL